jgi:hypothetical protein
MENENPGMLKETVHDAGDPNIGTETPAWDQTADPPDNDIDAYSFFSCLV